MEYTLDEPVSPNVSPKDYKQIVVFIPAHPERN